MSDLDEAGRALIALAGDAHDPTDADRARVRAALAGRLGAAAGLGLGAVAGLGATAKAAAGAGGVASTGGAGGGAAVAAAGIGSTLTTKLVGVALAITTAVGVGATVKLARRSAEAPAAAKSSEVHGRRTVAAAPPVLPVPAREPSTIKDVSSATPAGGPARSHEVPSRAAPSREAPRAAATPPGVQPPANIDTSEVTGTVAHPRSATASATDHACAPAASGANPAARRSESAVADEARLLHDGVRALRAGQPACALSLLDTHARYYPEGVLAEEREAERALALADLGRIAEARLAAAAFLRKHPASPLGVRLRHRIPGIDVADESR